MRESLSLMMERFLGRGDAAITVPPLDGALKPNTLLDRANSALSIAEPDNLIGGNDGLLFTSGNELLRLFEGSGGSSTVVQQFEQSINAVARSIDGGIAVALSNGELRFIGGAHHGRRITPEKAGKQQCVTALSFSGEDKLVVCNGSTVNAMVDWQRDLLEKEHTGTVSVIDLTTGKHTVVCDKLYFPYGVHVLEGGGEALVSESWRSRILRISLNGKSAPKTVIDGLPGYPARLSPRAGGGAWLAVFAPRSQLVEFVLRERTYRHTMMAEVDRRFWIAPALSSGNSFKEPMQGGALRQMGIMKPWAPTRSYGLVVGLDANFHPQLSFHCRAAGRRHGITSVQEVEGRIYMSSKGGNEIISIDLMNGE